MTTPAPGEPSQVPSEAPTASAGASRPAGRRHRLRWTFVLLGAVVVLFAAYLFLNPVGVANPAGAARPTSSFAEATARFDEVARREAARPDLLAECRSKLLTNGASTNRAIVLFHGYTNCPQQFAQLGEQLAAEGFNVYIPLMPEHGEADREHTSLGALSAEKLIDYANESADIATGLGDRVTVLGLSGGGTVAAYLAQFREEVDFAVPAAPYLGLPWAPNWFTPALVNLASILPPIGIGTSASAGSGTGTYAPYAYYDNNTRAAVAYMRLGQVTLADADRHPHRARQTLTVVNDADDTVNIPTIDVLTGRWRSLAPDATGERRFPASLKLPHDIIGPDRVDQRIAEVYPVLLDLIGSP